LASRERTDRLDLRDHEEISGHLVQRAHLAHPVKMVQLVLLVLLELPALKETVDQVDLLGSRVWSELLDQLELQDLLVHLATKECKVHRVPQVRLAHQVHMVTQDLKDLQDQLVLQELRGLLEIQVTLGLLVNRDQLV
jgi:hypothetical protein